MNSNKNSSDKLPDFICEGNLNLIGLNQLDRKYTLKCEKCNRIFYRDELQLKCDFRIIILTREEYKILRGGIDEDLKKFWGIEDE